MLLSEIGQATSMQAAIKRNLKPAGTFADVFGRNADEVADAVHEPDVDATVYKVDTNNPAAAAAVRSLLSAPPLIDLESAKVVRLMGANRVIVSNGRVYVSSYIKDRLVENHEAD